MKNKVLTILFLVGLFMSTSLLNVMAQENNTGDITDNSKMALGAFPTPEKGIVRYVIDLPAIVDEPAYKVEIIPGKIMKVDCNQHHLPGNLTENTAEGWGYSFFTITGEHNFVATTQMMCPEPKVEKFVPMETKIIDYNSNLPIVVYVPKGYEVRYKIWNSGDEQTASIK